MSVFRALLRVLVDAEAANPPPFVAEIKAGLADIKAMQVTTINRLNRMEWIMTEIQDDVARVRADEAAERAAFTQLLQRQADQAAQVQQQLDALKTQLATAGNSVSADVQSAFDDVHAQSAQLVADMNQALATVQQSAPVTEPPAQPTEPASGSEPVADQSAPATDQPTA